MMPIAGKRTRNSNIELMRIVAMLLIVAHHFSYHGGFSFDPATITFNMLWIQFIQLGGKVGVNVFVLISGYFLVAKRTSIITKAMKLWMQMLTYSLAISLAAVLLGFMVFNKDLLLEAIFPVSTHQWWFATSYFYLLLLSPLINYIIVLLKKNGHRVVLAIMLLVWCVLPSIGYVSPNVNVGAPYYSNLAWFITLYATGAYIRLWHDELKRNAAFYIIAAAGVYLLTFISAVVYDHLNTIQNEIEYYPTAFYEMNSLLVLIAAVLLFMGFKTLSINRSRLINTIASASFGVYLLHDHDLTRPFIWDMLFKNASFENSPYLVLYSIFAVLVVYIVCTLVELMRQGLLEKHYMPLIKKVSGWINGKIEALAVKRVI